MLTEEQSILFYRGLFRIYPPVSELPENQCMKRCCEAYLAVVGVKPTRDHVRIALAQHFENRMKRAWDLKQKYMILLFIRNIQLTNPEVLRVTKSLFHQRTRAGVINSCREEALHMFEEYSPEEREHWMGKVEEEFSKRAKEPNVLL